LAMRRAKARGMDPNRALDLGIAIIVSALLGILLLARLRERAQGWRIALGVLAVFVLYSVLT